ncbi:hypothetical protein [uncultured Planktomarina sp.]|uniref:hypothetical protein n=1 Tax=uncultured Planktomarina sp. TaxID=1538529 RepID=UPI0032604AB1
MEFTVGFILGALALLVGLVFLGLRNNARARPAQEKARTERLRKDAALITARTSLRAIADRYKIEPMAAKIAVKAEANIAKALGEPSILDEIIKRAERP